MTQPSGPEILTPSAVEDPSLHTGREILARFAVRSERSRQLLEQVAADLSSVVGQRLEIRQAESGQGASAGHTTWHDLELLPGAEGVGRIAAPPKELIRALAGHLSQVWQLCSGVESQLHHRLAELRAVFQISNALTGLGDLQSILECALRLAIQVMNVKAGSIRMTVGNTDELIIRASVNLSQAYFEKGPIFAHESELDTRSLGGEVVYVEDLSADDRVRFPDLVKHEKLRSFLSTGLIFKGRPLGVLRLYTSEIRTFSQIERDLLLVVSQQVATAIANAELLEEKRATREVQRQVQLASNVQRRMLPNRMPQWPGLDVAARYVPSLQLGGDFFDFIRFESNLGISIGDVVGKGVPAALLMASVRASLRAHALDIYDIDEVMARTNRAMTRDTMDNEFATIWYGVIDMKHHRLTYCNAGHEPALVFRIGIDEKTGRRTIEHRELRAGGMVVGIESGVKYDKGLFDLTLGDVIVLYSDGVPDAMDFQGHKFSRSRFIKVIGDFLLAREEGHPPAAADVVNHILWEVRRFIGLNRQSDDMTLMVVRVLE